VATPQPTPKREAVQAAVMQATEDLLAEGHAFQDLGIERIATKAGIGRTAFYFYFKDKRELLMRLAEEVTGILYTTADAWFSGRDGDPAAEMREALTVIARMYEEHGPLLRAIVEVSTYDPEAATYWRTLLGRFVVATEERIAAEQAAGRGADGPPGAIAFALVWMTERTFYEQMVQRTPHTTDELVDALTGIWLRGVYAT
jgi:AcrR family transcriptional regulator